MISRLQPELWQNMCFDHKSYIYRNLYFYIHIYNFWISISYIHGISNFEVDWTSPHLKSDLEWTLLKDYFVAICNIWGFPQIDLFDSRLNGQLPRYVSWNPDPYSMQV